MTSTRVERGPLRMRLLSWGIAYTPAAALAVLLPKCPLCIAAQLALIGVSIPLPSYARWIAIVSSIVSTPPPSGDRNEHRAGRGRPAATKESWRAESPSHPSLCLSMIGPNRPTFDPIDERTWLTRINANA